MTMKRETFVRPSRMVEAPEALRMWANEIEVKRAGDSLVISGTNPGGSAAQDLLQLFREYAFAPTKGCEPKGPHLEFANAESDEELIGFIKKWGPVAAPSFTEQTWSQDKPRPLWEAHAELDKDCKSEATMTECRRAVESLSRVRAEQAVVNAAVSLLKVSRETKPRRKAMVSAITQLIQAVMALRQQSVAPIATAETLIDSELWSSSLISECKLIDDEAARTPDTRAVSGLCHEVLCALVNRFPENLISTTDGVFPIPVAGDGMLPLIMFMLRQDLVSGRRLLICERCGDYFLRRRVGERACSSCKSALRAQRYYIRNREKVRRRKRKRRLKDKAKRLAQEKGLL